MATTGETQESRLGFTLGTDQVSFDLDESVYPLEAVYGAAYLFLDRCFVFLTRPGAGSVRVRLTAQVSSSPDELDNVAGEFANELLSQTMRVQLSQSAARIREYYTATALRSATAAPSVEELLAELESEDLLEDPLEIMVPWEEKHGGQDEESAPDKDPDAKDG